MTKSKNKENGHKIQDTVLTSFIYRFIIIFTWNIYKVKVMNTVYLNKSL